MKKSIKTKVIAFFMLMGVWVANFTAQNTVNMGYQESEDYMGNMLGFEPVVDEDGSLIDEDVELEGIGRIFQKRGINQGIRHFNRIRRSRRAKKRRNYLMANVTRGQMFLVGKKNKMAPDSQKSLAEGSLKFTEKILYFTKGFDSIGGIHEMIESNEKIGKGWSNLDDGGEVPGGVNVAVDYVALTQNKYDTGASETIFTNKLEPGYQNVPLAGAEFEITLDGKVIFNTLISQMNETRVIKGAMPSNQHAGINLRQRLFIPAGKRLNFLVKMPNGVTIVPGGSNEVGLRVLLFGDATNYR